MSLTKHDLATIKLLITASIEERIPTRIDQPALDIGESPLETTHNFMALNAHLNDLDDGLARLSEITDNNDIAIRKINHKLGIA
jgi:hypothetical protein